MDSPLSDAVFKDAFVDFTFSKEHLKIISALVAVQSEMGIALKDSTNPHFKSKYADYRSVWEAVGGFLNKQKIAFMVLPSGGPKLYNFTGLLMHETGEFIKCSVDIEALRAGPQEFGSLSTYMKRYLLQLLTGVATDEDDDANKANGKKDLPPEPSPKPQTEKPKSGYTPRPVPNAAPQTSIEADVNLMLKSYNSKGVSTQDILAYFQYTSEKQINQKDIDNLRSIWKDLASGQLSVHDLFLPPVPPQDLDFTPFESDPNQDDFDRFMGDR